MTATLLIVDDDPQMCAMLRQGLEACGHTVDTSTSAKDAMVRLVARDYDAMVTDLRMGGINGLTLCQHVVDNQPDVPVVVITAFGSMETAVEAMRAGAYDFVTKPFDLETLRITVQRAVAHRRANAKRPRPASSNDTPIAPRRMIGASSEMCHLFDLIERVAPSSAAVLVCGESGTGKELVARELHDRSRQAAGPFVAINCAAMPEALLESELFGYEKGAFTDARTDRKGLFQQADGGTLFLDEIGELPLGLQPKLLRALQERAVRPIGGKREHPFSARLVAATNRDLEAAVAAGTFREDLYYRIQVVQLDVPPLRQRGEDVLMLADYFIKRFAAQMDVMVMGLRPSAGQCLTAYNWPGNVRELSNCIERAVTLCRYAELTRDDLPRKIASASPPVLTPLPPLPSAAPEPQPLVAMEEVERQHVLRVFAATGKNKSLTAKILSLNRKTLYRKLRRYGAIAEEGESLDSGMLHGAESD